MRDYQKIVLYAIEKIKNKIRASYIEYDSSLESYINETERGKIEKYGTYEPFVRKFLKEKCIMKSKGEGLKSIIKKWYAPHKVDDSAV